MNFKFITLTFRVGFLDYHLYLSYDGAAICLRAAWQLETLLGRCENLDRNLDVHFDIVMFKIECGFNDNWSRLYRQYSSMVWRPTSLSFWRPTSLFLKGLMNKTGSLEGVWLRPLGGYWAAYTRERSGRGVINYVIPGCLLLSQCCFSGSDCLM